MESLSLGLIICASIGIGVVFAYYLQRELDDIRLIQSLETRPRLFNNDESAAARVVNLLEEAEEILEMFDDGNSFDGSLYNNPSFLDAIQAKLQDKPAFRIRCYFNCNDPELEFVCKFKDHPQVNIYVRKDGTRPPDRHYKIIDGGRKAYLSEHDLGDDSRTYKEIACPDFTKKQIRRAFDILFKDIQQKTERFNLVGA